MPAGGFSPRRHWLLAPLLLAAFLLVLSEFLTLREITAITAVIETKKAGAHHGYALLVIGVALALMSWGAVVGGSRAARIAVLVLALAACFIVFAIDAPKVGAEGLTAERYEQAKASPKLGFYLESAGAVLALLGAAGLFLLRPAERREPRARPSARVRAPE